MAIWSGESVEVFVFTETPRSPVREYTFDEHSYVFVPCYPLVSIQVVVDLNQKCYDFGVNWSEDGF